MFMVRNRALRSRGRLPSQEECYRLDPTKSTVENASIIFRTLCIKETTESKRLSLLNAFVRLHMPPNNINSNSEYAYTTSEYLYCLSSSLVHHFTQIRAGTLRAMRYIIKTSKDVQEFNNLQLPHLISRSLDVLLDNEEERVQALKLIRKLLGTAPEIISPIMVRSLVALAESFVEDGDRMLRAYLAVLCEFGVLNPTLLIVCGGISAITRNVLECHSPRIAESLCGVLLHLLEWPQTRNISGVSLDCLAASYCDFTYRLGIMDKNKDARDLRFTCSRLALMSVLRSWAGTIHFCDPKKPSGLKAIVDVLYLNQLEVRKAILDLLYELLYLQQPVWTDEYSVALTVVDPADYQDSWRLTDGFVAMEGRCVLPSLANRVPNINEIHTSLLLYCFLETGLLNALVEVIISSDTFISVRATVLLGKLLQLMHTHLPAEIFNTGATLPTLVASATQGNHQAKAAITALQTLHQMLRNRPAACSLFLDTIIQSGSIIHSKIFKREIDACGHVDVIARGDIGGAGGNSIGGFGTLERSRHDSVGSSTSTSGDERMPRRGFTRSSIRPNSIRKFFENLKQSDLLRDSNVLSNEDGKTWDWEIIIAILRSGNINSNSKMDDNQTRFIKRLVNFYKPSSNRFSHQDLGHGRHIAPFVGAGLDLIDWLVSSQELECVRLLTDLFSDIHGQLMAITTSRSAHDCLFSPQHMSSTMCQKYFLYIGRMCRTKRGIGILNNTNVFKQLMNIVTNTLHVCYIKLIVSGLDYSFDEYPRKVLQKAMTASDRRDGRLYSTQFMLVLLRAKLQNFEVWGLPMLIQQTKDSNRVVALTAMEILDEACSDRTYLEELVCTWPDFKSIGDAGILLMIRYYSIPRGLNNTNARIQQEIKYWSKIYNKRYVLLLEADTHSVLTSLTKNEDGAYSRRSCSSRPIIIPPNILPHLYGQLAQTSQGMTNLMNHGDIPDLVDLLALAKCTTERECIELKSAMYAIGNTATSKIGIEQLLFVDLKIFEKIIYFVKYCDVFSIRAVALHVLCLIGSTKTGADILYKLDWMCVRHDRDTSWPICQPEDWLSKHLTPIRHSIDEVPPYNYTALDDINGTSGVFNNFNNTIDESAATFYFDESCDKVDATSSDMDLNVLSNTARSKTLPESAATPRSFYKHTRSLSESKTSEGLTSMTIGPNQIVVTTNRTRFNSGTDSNTSGVSSCESVYGRYMLSDLHNTLSPIPSSSNLLEVKKSNEPFRRISLTGASFRENTMSPQDVQGYAKLRKLRSSQRPMFSESAAEELADFIAIGQQINRKLKVRSLDRQSLTNRMDLIDYPMKPIPYVQDIDISNETETIGPCYKGICLPKNILDIFHTETPPGTYVSRLTHEIDAINLIRSNSNTATAAGNATTSSSAAQTRTLPPHQQQLQQQNQPQPALLQSFIADAVTEGDESSVSSLSDISTNSKRSKWIGKHNRNSCLHCCRSKLTRQMLTQQSIASGWDPPTTSTSDILRRKNSSLMQLSDISFNSPESVFSEDCMPDRITASILRHVQKMANPVWSKQSKMALLEVKQKHPQSFQDICLYSEVCKSLSANTYRLYARRFLQELFLDLNFDSFNSESTDIINRKMLDVEILEPAGAAAIGYEASVAQSPAKKIGSSSSTNNNSNVLNATTTNGTRESNSSSGGSGVPGPGGLAHSENVYAANKLNLRLSSQLASVYETSVENLSESFGKMNKKLSLTPNNNTNHFTTADPSNNFNSKSPSLSTAAASSPLAKTTATITAITTTTATTATASTIIKNENSSATKNFMRPRFNTIDLDLRCTVNKFPITEERKQIQAQLQSKNNGDTPRVVKCRSLSSSVTSPTSELAPTLNTATTPTATTSAGHFFPSLLRSSSNKSEATLSKSNEDIKPTTAITNSTLRYSFNRNYK